MGRPLLRRADPAESFRGLVFRQSLIACLFVAPAVFADEPPPSDAGAVVRLESEAEPEGEPEPGASEPSEADGTGAPLRPVGEVTVTATRAERDVLEVAGNVTVIDRAEIDSSGVRNLPDLLRRQAGLFVTNTTTNLAGYTIDGRGFNNGGGNGGNMLVQVDGRRVNEPDSDVADWALISLDEVESIEIVRGAASALYGDNATAGVVNIRTRAVEGPPRAIARGRVGRYDTGGGSLSAAGSFGPATGSLYVEGQTTDGYRDQSAFEAQNYQGGLEWSLYDRVLVGVRGGYHTDRREFPGSLSEQDIRDLGRRAANPDNAGDRGEIESGFVHGWVDAILAEDIRLSVQPFYRPRSDDFRFTSLAFGDTLVETDKWSAGFDAQVEVDLAVFDLPNRLIVGTEYLHDERSSASTSSDLFGSCSQPLTTTHTDSVRNLGAFFVQYELRPHPQVLLAAGARYDHAFLDVEARNRDPLCGAAEDATPEYGVWSPRASVTWQPLPQLALYGAYTRGFRIPSLDEASPLVFPGFVSLPVLEEQTSNGGDIGVKYRDERVQAGLSLFLVMVDDEILFDPVTFENRNLGLVRHRGIEAMLDVQIVSWLSLQGNYTFDDVRILDDDIPEIEDSRMPVTPRHRGTAGVFVTFPWDLELRASANFVGERNLANDFGQAGGHVAPLPFHATLDLLAAWRPTLGEHWGGALSFALRNVNDARYEDFGARFGDGRFLYPAAERTWEVGFEVSFRR
jgi:outer membrane receptor protein involved in Fe transport